MRRPFPRRWKEQQRSTWVTAKSVRGVLFIVFLACWAGGFFYFMTRRRDTKPAEAKNAVEKEVAKPVGGEDFTWSGPRIGYLPGCPETGCKRFSYFWEAQDACVAQGESCGGVTQTTKNDRASLKFETRGGKSPKSGSNQGSEWSYLKGAPIPNDPFGRNGEKWNYDIVDEELDRTGSKINGHETIFIGIASYRDVWCPRSIESAFERATHPERIFFGAVEQNAEGDLPCLPACDENPDLVSCKHIQNVQVTHVQAKNAKGPTYARHLSELLYDGQYYAMQVDAHTIFSAGWDEEAIGQFKRIKNDYAVMSTYLSNFYGGIDDKGNALTRTAPIICETKMNRDGMLTHLAAQGPGKWPDRWTNMPLISPYLGAGLIFSRGHRLIRTPYDCCLEQLFAGEEFSLAARAWTAGYDFYGPVKDFAFHPYNRPEKDGRPPTFYENWDKISGREKQRIAKKRIRHILGQDESKVPDVKNVPLNDEDISKYGLGTKRSLQDYLDVFSLDLTPGDDVEEKNHCQDALAGTLMDYMHAFVRKNGRGIDFRYVRYGRLHTDAR